MRPMYVFYDVLDTGAQANIKKPKNLANLNQSCLLRPDCWIASGLDLAFRVNTDHQVNPDSGHFYSYVWDRFLQLLFL